MSDEFDINDLFADVTPVAVAEPPAPTPTSEPTPVIAEEDEPIPFEPSQTNHWFDAACGKISQAVEAENIAIPIVAGSVDETHLAIVSAAHEVQTAVDRVGQTAFTVAKSKAIYKSAKRDHQAALDALQSLMDNGPTITQVTQDSLNSNNTDPPLLIGEIRVVLLKDIEDTYPDRSWKKGDEVLACVDKEGKVYIPLDDDAMNGTYFNSESEYKVVGPGATGWDTPAAKAIVDRVAHAENQSLPFAEADENDPRLDVSLEDTPLTKALVATLANGDVHTVRDFVICWRENALIEIPKLGKAKIAKAEAVIAEFWAKANANIETEVMPTLDKKEST